MESTEDRYIVHLDVFEGPLDLLLHLISKHELDIFDIPISFVTSKYLEYLDFMQHLNLDVASDYLEMAATLALIKSRMLVPAELASEDESLEEGPDPREELVRRLLEYQKYKVAAEDLIKRPMLGRDTFGRGAQEAIEDGERDLEAPGLFALLEAFHQIISRTDYDSSHRVTIVRISVSQRINQLVDLLRERRQMRFEELFGDHQSVSDLVVTFLSILEMSKLGLSRVHQAGVHGEIYISATEGLDAKMDDILKDIEE